MLLRLIGALLLMSATGKAGFIVARKLGERVELLRELENLLRILSTQVDYALTPFPDALVAAGRISSSAVKGFCSFVLKELHNGKSLEMAWKEGVETLLERTPLHPEDLAPLLSLAPVLGVSDRKDQVRHLQLAQELLRQRQYTADVDAKNNQKLWRSAGVLVGLMVVLLLI